MGASLHQDSLGRLNEPSPLDPIPAGNDSADLDRASSVPDPVKKSSKAQNFAWSGDHSLRDSFGWMFLFDEKFRCFI